MDKLILWIGGILIGLGIGMQIRDAKLEKEIKSLNQIIQTQNDMLVNKCGIQ